MTRSLTFYTNPQSRGRIIRWMLEEVGAPYETVTLDFGTSMKDIDYLAINPMGKVPAIRHGDTVVTECAAICAYLADAFPEANLAPPHGSERRGPYYRWLFFTAGPVEAAVTNQALKVEVGPEQKGFVGYGCFEETIDNLEHAILPGPYICGDQFTAADVYVGAQIGWGLMFGTIPKRPAFEDYVGRLQSRPAAIRANELDDALMPKQEEPA
ncbi:glutathione S-transferase family protein [Sphingosinicella sp. LHD-64]|uniref:glutathione S-transferase family protein n=1 Tax=Sphingosinicella sp. LHD-64 TaxID=3072139 RepID=UPI00280CC02E|nr:glutathione S-transferase family protein [Sphingosinicella sp. LHD-64]MDQ8757868.1 glutathione S-transferase family protein [Sphingosinicella sp. LHD-64]